MGSLVKSESALRELRAAASTAEAVLLPLLHPGVAGEVAGVAELLDHAGRDIRRVGRRSAGRRRGPRRESRAGLSGEPALEPPAWRASPGSPSPARGFFSSWYALDHGRVAERVPLLLGLRAEHRLQGPGDPLATPPRPAR